MKSKNFVLCKNCTSFLNTKPMPRCGSSKYIDVVDGHERRACLVERLDGIGRCGTMGNNFTEKAKK